MLPRYTSCAPAVAVLTRDVFNRSVAGCSAVEDAALASQGPATAWGLPQLQGLAATRQRRGLSRRVNLCNPFTAKLLLPPPAGAKQPAAAVAVDSALPNALQPHILT
jgi:hypothetical protein